MLAPQVLLVLLAGLVWWTDALPIPTALPSAADWGLGGLLLLGAIACMRPFWRAAVLARAPALRLFTPRSDRERRQWVVLSGVAGVSEELVWRGVFYETLNGITGDPGIALFGATASFALAHMVQGWRSVFAIGLFALGFHGLVFATGTLIVAMAVHFLYDVAAGFAYARLAVKHGYFERL